MTLQGPAGINLVSGRGKDEMTLESSARGRLLLPPHFGILECHAFLRHHPFSNPPGEKRRGGRQRNSFAPECCTSCLFDSIQPLLSSMHQDSTPGLRLDQHCNGGQRTITNWPLQLCEPRSMFPEEMRTGRISDARFVPAFRLRSHHPPPS